MALTIYRYACLKCKPSEHTVPAEHLTAAKVIRGITPYNKVAHGWVEYDRPLTYEQLVKYDFEPLQTLHIHVGLYMGTIPWKKKEVELDADTLPEG